MENLGSEVKKEGSKKDEVHKIEESHKEEAKA